MFFTEVAVGECQHLGCDGSTRELILVHSFGCFERPTHSLISVYRRTVRWEVDDIICVAIIDDVGVRQYIICREDRFATLVEFHLAAIKMYERWYPSLLDGTKEMEALHKLLWEV